MNVIVTSEKEKLPAVYAELVREDKAIPGDVSFFEKQVVPSDLAKTMGMAVGLAIAGVLIILFGVALFKVVGPQNRMLLGLTPVVTGCVFIFAAYMMVNSIKTRRELMARQAGGAQTRVGIFLTSEALMEVNEFGYTVIPREFFRGRAGDTINYEMPTGAKSFKLPRNLVRCDAAAMEAAIDRWAQEAGARR